MNLNMKKYLLISLNIIILVAIGYYGYQLNKDIQNQLSGHNNFSNENYNFQATGTLTKDGPGLKSGIWYLVTDLPGEPMSKIELNFFEKSECYIGSFLTECGKLNFPNGTRVIVSGNKTANLVIVQNLTAEQNSDLIRVDNITNGSELSSPTIIRGEARGSWFFEASFPVRLLSVDGKLLTTTIAVAEGEWMTNNFVPFKADLNFMVSTNTPAELIIAADNPSGLPQYERDVRYLVNLVPTKNLKSIYLYYYNPENDRDENGNLMCSEKGLVGLSRNLPENNEIILNTINLLLKGDLTDSEKSAGLSSEFPLPGVAIKSLKNINGVVNLELEDPQNKTSGGSCRVNIMRAQIEKTIRQFSGVNQVKIIPDEIFQP